MCNTCGCTITPGNKHLAYQPEKGGEDTITLLQDLLAANDQQAMHNRGHFNRHGVLAINLMSAPGAGKTLLLEATIDALRDEFRLAVIEGDLETENDAERIRAKGIPVIQITTGSACHLDAHMVHQALHRMALDEIDILFIENVGNLVCPASFDLGHHRNAVLLSATEGDDKPAKYPVMFRSADIVLLSKSDLLPMLDDFDPDKAQQCLRALASSVPMLTLSAKKKTGLDNWLHWLRQEASAQYTPTPAHDDYGQSMAR